MILSILLAMILLATWALNAVRLFNGFGGFAHHARLDGRSYEENVLKPAAKHTNDKIAVLSVDGVIASFGNSPTADLVTQIKDQLELAGKDDDVKAVILKVDSPGGEVLASDEIYRAIREFQKEHDKPVVASMGSLAASGGYYVSAPCRWIVANELTITGSIGVIMQSFNFSGLMDKVGVQPVTFKSGKFKDMMSSTKKPEEISPEEKQMVQRLIDETFEKFKSVVAEGRGWAKKENGDEGRALASNWKDFADGRILSGKQALELGFVDELGDFDAAVDRTKNIAGITDAALIEYQQPFDFSNLFHLVGKSDAKGLKIDLGLDVPRLRAGRLYFLSTSVIH